MKVLFIGGTQRGYLTLKALLETGAHVVGIISLAQDPHETERYEESIRVLAQMNHIPILETKRMRDRDYVSILRQEIKPDLAFVVGCRILIPPEIYEIPPLGMLAVHDSLLPEYRGFAPLNWSILNGERQTGVTLFYLSEQMDGGDIVAQRPVPIPPGATAPQVYHATCEATVELVLENCPLLAQGVAPRVAQDYTQGSFTCSRTPDDGLIDWAASATVIHNQVRALTYPYPGAFTYYKAKKLMIWRARELESARPFVGRIPGRVVEISTSKGFVDVLTGDGIVRLEEVQFEDGDPISPSNAIKSIRDTLGVSTVDLLNRIYELELQLAQLRKESTRDSI